MTARVAPARWFRAHYLIALLPAALLLLASASPAHASDGAPDDAGQRIVQVALQYQGQHGGQCFPFVRRVIEEALGWPMGFGYHDGYIQGGAVQVPIESAQAGDVIQLVNPNDNGPGASHPGMHTAIVIERASDGTFKVIDSNYGWDEIVRVHDGYDPVAAAARYTDLGVRVYRFSLDRQPSGVSTINDGPLQAAEVAFEAGETARVDTTGSCLNLRASPSTSGQVIRCLPNGTTLTILSGTSEGSGFRWQQVQAGGDVGWVADTFLAPAGSAPPPSNPTSPSPPQNTARIIGGSVPASGGLALLLWDGGSLSAFISEVNAQDCGLLSAWSTADGRMIGHIVGAPDFVNREWIDRYPGDLPRLPLLAMCARPGGNQAVNETPSQPSAPGGSGPVDSGPTNGRPPGPAGNEE